MELDLRKNGLTIDQSKEISLLEPEIRKEYNDYIGELVRINNVSDITWLLGVTCRNPYASLIYDRFCRLRMLEKFIEKNIYIKKILVDSYNLKKVVERLCSANGYESVVVCTGKNKSQLRVITSNIIKSTILISNLFAWPKIIRGKKVPLESIIYLDTAISENSFDKNHNLKDHCFPGLVESIPDNKDKNRVWHAPTLMGVRTPIQYINIFKSVRKSPQKYLMEGDWLTLKDYFSALIDTIVLGRKIPFIPEWNGLDISEIVQEEIATKIGSTSILYPILRYLFVKKLKENNVKIDIVIDWHENQVIDRALNLAVNKYYPNVYVKGYQGFIVSEYYVSHDPTCYEITAGTIPDEICVVGEAFVNEKKKYCDKIKVTAAPAFRFQGVLRFKRDIHTHKDIILLALPVQIEDSRDIIQMCSKAVIDKKTKLVIKRHPSVSIKMINTMIPESLDDRFHFTEAPLYDLLQKTRLLVSSGSSVCFEAVACGVPVAISGSMSGPTMNPLEYRVDKKNWNICYTPACIEEMLSKHIETTNFDISKYLKPVTRENVREFLQL